MEKAAGELRSLADDLFWPFRDYARVQDFTREAEAASLIISGLGFFIAWLGFAGTIPSAVGALGLANSVLEILLRVWYNKTDVWQELNAKKRGTAFLLNILVGLMLYFWLVPSAIYTPTATTVQFITGLIVTYIAGATYMRTYTHMVSSHAHEATKILIPSAATIGVVVLLLGSLEPVLQGFGADTMVELLQNEPKNITEG